MPDPVPASDPGIPKIIETLIKAAPGALQVQLREALQKASIINPDDPVFELVLVLELVGIYYQRIAATVAKAGTDIDASLTDRVRKLQGLAQILQQATDKLENVAPEIIERFPVDVIVRQVLVKIDAEIKALPIEKLEQNLTAARGTMLGLADDVKRNTDRLKASSEEVEKAARKIQATNIPSVTVGWAILWLVIGAAITAFAFSFVVWNCLSDVKRVLPFVHPGEAGAKIVVPKADYKAATKDQDGAVTIELNP